MPVNKDSEEYKSSRCVHILTKGVRKDLQCENKKCLNSDKCKSHCRLVAKVKVEEATPKVKPEKVKVEKPKSKSKAGKVLE
tara:strand:+ start:278 stop:520 length:243 start_codon:yes stop_codon:yes gene_type:complete